MSLQIIIIKKPFFLFETELIKKVVLLSVLVLEDVRGINLVDLAVVFTKDAITNG